MALAAIETCLMNLTCFSVQTFEKNQYREQERWSVSGIELSLTLAEYGQPHWRNEVMRWDIVDANRDGSVVSAGYEGPTREMPSTKCPFEETVRSFRLRSAM